MAAFRIALILLAILAISIADALWDRGVCLGTNGNNLPSASDIVGLYKENGIGRIRLFEPNTSVLEALRSSKINVSLGVRNEEIPNIASGPNAAFTWFNTHVKPYLNDVVFQYIVVGNDVIPSEYSRYIAPAAMQNFQTIIDKQKLENIKVTTVISTNALGTFSPPSSGAFLDEATESVVSILQFLSEHQTPLMINVYPYFAYAADPVKITLDYALFKANTSVVQDGNLSYQNLFDALVDAFFYSAMEKQGVDDVGVLISETGWPSNGNGNITTPELAATYNKNFVVHILYFGTPKRPVDFMQWFVFEMFEENLKTTVVEQHFGLYHPNMEPAYPNIFLGS